MHLVAIRFRNSEGFTIVELLIVIVVIGILAAVTMVAYNGITSRAYETGVQTDLVNFSKKLEIYKTTSTNGSYPVVSADLDTLGFKFNASVYRTGSDYRTNVLYCRIPGSPAGSMSTDYALLATTKSNKQLYIQGSLGNSVREHTATTWFSTENWDPRCQTVMGASAVSISGGAGYYDTSTPKWRTWTGL